MRTSKGILVSILLGSATLAGAAGRMVSGYPEPAASQAATIDSHPDMHKGLRALRMAKDHLSDGTRDPGGNRVAAIRATEDAIRKCEAALQAEK